MQDDNALLMYSNIITDYYGRPLVPKFTDARIIRTCSVHIMANTYACSSSNQPDVTCVQSN